MAAFKLRTLNNTKIPDVPSEPMEEEYEVNHAERTKLFNQGLEMDPVVQKAAQKCQYCQTELKGPCASQFADLYKCAVTKGDKHITSSKCDSYADVYISCVEEDYTVRQTQCPMYMTFLRQNIMSSPCAKQLKMMTKCAEIRGKGIGQADRETIRSIPFA